MHIKVDALCEHWWPPEQLPGKKSGHMFHPPCRQGPLRSVCLQRDSDYVSLRSGLTLLHCQARLLWCHERVGWREEWRFVVFDGERRICLYGVDLVSMIFRSAFVHDTPHLRVHGAGPSVTMKLKKFVTTARAPIDFLINLNLNKPCNTYAAHYINKRTTDLFPI